MYAFNVSLNVKHLFIYRDGKRERGVCISQAGKPRSREFALGEIGGKGRGLQGVG